MSYWYNIARKNEDVKNIHLKLIVFCNTASLCNVLLIAILYH